ncbi:methionine ABC transporter ATP-binding protein [Niveibacterium sp.]|uniref:methionine ABC transporter ATP-binding protein n=1 Tax=Niveibacterium sp. TaxID=2017444 RepID=UPI0035B243B7
MIELSHVSHSFRTPAGGTVRAVDDVSLQIAQGEIFGIIGRSGAGKSTLVRTLNLLTRPEQGQIRVDGRNLFDLDEDALLRARRQIGMIFQHFNLLASRTVYGNVALPLELVGLSPKVIASEVNNLLALVGLADEAERYPHQLSGGQKQRVGIARALANNPKVLLSDEATSALDPETTRAILDLLKRINRELGLTIVLITHEMQVVKQICDRVAVMDAGRIIETGRVLDVFRSPQTDLTRTLIGDVIAHELPPTVLDRVRRRIASRTDGAAPERLLRLSFAGDDVDRPLLSDAVKRFGVDFNILHGQIDEIQGQAFASLTLLARASEEAIRGTLDLLRGHDVRIEELNHVL